VLLIGGWAMFGGAVLQAAKLLFQSAQLTVQPASLSDLDKAAGLLAETVAILGVQGTLAILLRKPSNALKDQFFADRNNPMPFSWKTFKDLPNNRWWGYKPSVQGTKTLDAGVGGTDVYTGDKI